MSGREVSIRSLTTILLPQLMSPFDPDMAAFLHSEMRKNGVRLALGRAVAGFETRDGGVDVLLKDEAPLHADMVVLAIGVTP